MAPQRQLPWKVSVILDVPRFLPCQYTARHHRKTGLANRPRGIEVAARAQLQAVYPDPEDQGVLLKHRERQQVHDLSLIHI